MKVLYNNKGFIFREEQREILKITGMTKTEFVKVMNHGFGSIEMTFYEASQIVNWFNENGYITNPIESMEPIRADSYWDAVEELVKSNSISITGGDIEQGIIKASEYHGGEMITKFYQITKP